MIESADKEHTDMEGQLYGHTKEYYSTLKGGGNSAVCYNMDGLWGHYVVRNKLDMERQVSHDFIYMCP